MRILFFTEIPTPYRIDFFNKLSKKHELLVLFDDYSVKGRNKNWNKGKKCEFNYIVIKKKKEIFKYIQEFKNDVIVITNYCLKNELLAIFYMKLKRIKYFMEIDGGIVKNDNFIKKTLKTFLISSASIYLSPSDMSDKYLIKYGAQKESVKRYAFTSVNKEDLEKNNKLLKEKIKIKKDLDLQEEIIVLGVGQFIHRKGFDLLIKASKKFNKNIGVYIIGDNPTEEYLKLYKELKCDNIHFIGFQDSESLKKYYAASDIFVLPTREDIWGLVINEAISFGLPVITTDNCIAGLELIKNDIGGYIIKTDNVEEISKYVNKLADDKKIREKMSKNNLELAKKYTIDDMVEQNEKIFSEGL